MGFFFKSIVKTPGEQILLVVDSTYYTQVMQSNIHRDSDLPRFLNRKILVDILKDQNSDMRKKKP